jgi:hypothetical protein
MATSTRAATSSPRDVSAGAGAASEMQVPGWRPSQRSRGSSQAVSQQIPATQKPDAHR